MWYYVHYQYTNDGDFMATTMILGYEQEIFDKANTMPFRNLDTARIWDVWIELLRFMRYDNVRN